MTDKTAFTEEERGAIEETIRALYSEVVAATEQVDVDRAYASSSNVYEIGSIFNGVFLLSLDQQIARSRKRLANLQGQAVNMAETRVAVLGPNAAVLVARGSGTATFKDGTTFESPFADTVVFAKIEDDWRIIHSHQSFPREMS